jgi:hypothetical protein
MKSWRFRFLWIGIGAAAVYGMVCADVVLRARHAYLEGEKAANPREAYAWYESAATLFTPPESPWSRLAREKLPMAKERWKADLRARHVAFDDSMLQ